MRTDPRLSLVTLSCLCTLALAPACGPPTVDCTTDECAAEGTGDTGPDETGDTGDNPGGPISISRDVDILFVIDNSGSMGEEQALLATNVAPFINLLENEDVEADYRIGITTTDMGNPWCPDTTPEQGRLVLSSCKTRLGDFLFSDDVDVQDLACNDICTLEEADLEILPTTTDVDPNPQPRPWLQRIAGMKNIPSSTPTADAFTCFAPQGVNGCGFESQLESMYFALVRTWTESEASYGFMRDNATLAVIFLTDEADCSYNPEWSEIFDFDGGQVFWSDPQAPAPTSAVCWNAGVQCTGDPSNYDACEAVNKGVDGEIGVSDELAVLHPVGRYIGLLEELEQQKQMSSGGQVIVSLIGGVDETGLPFYANSDDPEFQDLFGIGPGCEAPNPADPNSPIQAIPPGRLSDVTEAITAESMFSICAEDYTPALEGVADAIRSQLRPLCFQYCVADTDPATEIVDASCSLSEVPGGPIAECLRDADGYVIDPETNDYAMPAEDVNVCYALRTDKAGLSMGIEDDMSPDCIDANFNLEFAIERRPGFPGADGVTLSADCELANSPEVTCPGIGG